jgi:hypothetical protein
MSQMVEFVGRFLSNRWFLIGGVERVVKVEPEGDGREGEKCTQQSGSASAS